MYLTLSVELVAGIRKNCILRYPESPTFQTSVLDYPNSTNCIEQTETSEPILIIGKIDYFDKLVGVMYNWAFDPIGGAIATTVYGTSTTMSFFGQCSLDHYFKIDFDTKKFLIGEIASITAFSSTLTYIHHLSYLKNADGTNAVTFDVIYRVHFDPDTTACTSGGTLTPTVVKILEVRSPLGPYHNELGNCWLRQGFS